jgi:dGTPase
MLRSLDQFIQLEDTSLSPLAFPHSLSDDRVYAEEPHPFRLPLSRDRDRVLHSRSFKRLGYKTQVFVNSVGDHFRTRLTHTLEVAAVSRTLSSMLGLNAYLSEVIALSHDLGHPPFGHSGQDALSDLMKGHDGFEHNKQSLRIVTYLEKRYPNFLGLNLCKITLAGLMKHGGSYKQTDNYRSKQGISLEAMITDISDEIAYNSHDIEDGLEYGYLRVSDLMENSLWKSLYIEAKKQYAGSTEKIILRTTVRKLMNEMITDLAHTIHEGLEQAGISSKARLDEMYMEGLRPVQFSPPMLQNIQDLKKLLYQNLYMHPKVLEMTDRGKMIIEKLFLYYLKCPDKIPEEHKIRIDNDGLHRVICDYIAGMTDRYAEQCYEIMDNG